MLRKIKRSRGEKDRAELSDMSQTEPSEADMIKERSTEQIPPSLYIHLTVASGRRSATQSILSQGITDIGEAEALYNAESVCVCYRE